MHGSEGRWLGQDSVALFLGLYNSGDLIISCLLVFRQAAES